MEEVQAKVEHRARHGLAIDRDVRLVEVPAARAVATGLGGVSRRTIAREGKRGRARTGR